MQLNRQHLIIGTLLLAIGLIEAFTCPDYCQCTEIHHNNRHSYNHAKCTSLEGLRKLGKTSDLHSLDLSGTNLTKITNQLDKLTNLTKIDLHDNRLSEVNCLSTKRVRTLNLSNNRITSGKLAKIPPFVKHLNLTHNDITVLPEDFKNLIHLKSLELADNPLNCTFETLEVRNWLQERRVWTDRPIRCMAPLQYKGRSWLQVRQADVYDGNGLDEPRMLPSANDDENDLMLGDDPNAGLNEHYDNEQFDHEEFLPVIQDNRLHDRRDAQSDENISNDADYDEGSGDSSNDEIVNASPVLANTNNSHAEEYEGSGDDNHLQPIIENDEVISNETNSAESETDLESTTDSEATTIPIPISLNSEESNVNSSESISTELAPLIDSGEEQDEEEEKHDEEETSTAPVAVTEELILPVKHIPVDAEYIEPENGVENTSNQSESAKIDSSVHESRSTYILLAILGILLIALILYVAAKRSRSPVKNRRNNNDIESPAQELLNMDKNNLGKPVATNQVEFIPLIPEKHANADKKNNLFNAQEPLLQKLAEENEPNGDSVNGKDETDLQVPSQQLNGNATTPLQPNGVHKENGNAIDEKKPYQSVSPKPSRYSPVSDFV